MNNETLIQCLIDDFFTEVSTTDLDDVVLNYVKGMARSYIRKAFHQGRFAGATEKAAEVRSVLMIDNPESTR